MKNKKFTKVALIALAMALVCVVSVLGTVAYLTSQTETVTNTFTVGNVAITLDEAKVDEYGVALTGEAAARVTANEYKLIPSHTYVKDPTVHVAEGSEASYLFVKVVNGIADIEAASVDGGYQNIEAQMIAKGWTKLEGKENIWYYNTTVDARAAAVDVKVFDQFQIATGADISTYGGATITIDALAVQADGFADAKAAYAANSLLG